MKILVYGYCQEVEVKMLTQFDDIIEVLEQDLKNKIEYN